MSPAAIALLGVVLLAGSLLLDFVMPTTAALYRNILFGASVLAFVAAAAFGYQRLRHQLSRRGTRSGFGILARSALVAGIIVVVNAIGLIVPTRIDMTGLAQFTLTSQTQDMLRQIKDPVTIKSFFSPGPTSVVRDMARNLVREYQLGAGSIDFQEIDPELRPDLARQSGVDQVGALVGVLVISGPQGERKVFGPDILAGAEHALTSALIEVTGQRQKTIFFTAGHGEPQPSAALAQAGEGLRDNLFRVAELTTLEPDGVPKDAAALVVAGRQQPMSPGEIAGIRAYAEAGGNVMLLVDPDPDPSVVSLLADWGIAVAPGRIVEPRAHVVPNPDNPLVTRERNEFAIADMYFPGATAVFPNAEPARDIEIKALAWTTPDAWLETGDYASAPVFDASTERKGPFAIGALRSPTAPSSTVGRIAVIGDSDFVTDPHFHNGGNGALFLRTVNWLTAGEQVVSIDRKAMTTRRLLLSAESARFLNLSSIALPPTLVLIAGMAVWWRRRRT